MKSHILIPVAIIVVTAFSQRASACSNIIVTKGASKDGSCIVSYAADSHWLYGSLDFRKAADHGKGERLPIIEWDTCRPLGSIPQVPHTYQTVGNQNEHQLIIAETTWGGRMEQMDTTGGIDYGSLIYVALQRARTAREAIEVIVSLANEYGYHSEGETFSIADTGEAWIMDLVGKGSDGNRGIVWVARRIPDGYICAHANQCRITRFPLNDPENTLYAPDVISYAREQGWFVGRDEEFSFREAYCPLDFGTVRGCDARAWAAFNKLCDGQFTYTDDAYGLSSGNADETTRPSSDWLRYAMGYDISGEMPLWVKPSRKIGVKDVADMMRDHFEGTPMDMRTDIGAGGNACPYRWRPMDFEWEGRTYLNERAIATQQTGFWFVAQARGWLPDMIGALQWFGCDDAATSYLTPIYSNTAKVPECLRTGNGDLIHYSATSQFWICNRVTNSCYRMYNQMEPVVRKEIDDYENRCLERISSIDDELLRVWNGRTGRHPGRRAASRRVRRGLTNFSVDNAQQQFRHWVALEEMLLVKFIDGNVKAQNPDGTFVHCRYNSGIPDGLTQPGYTDRWKAAVAKDNGEVLEVR